MTTAYKSSLRKVLVRTLTAGLVVIMAYIPFHAVFSVGIGALTGLPLLAKSWKEIFLGLLAAVALYLLVTDKKLLKNFITSRINQLGLAFVAWHVVLVPFSLQHGLNAVAAGLAIDLRFIIYFLLIRLALQLNPNVWRYLLKAFAISALVVLSFGILQQYILPADILKYLGYSKDTISPYLTVDKNPNFIRINSTLRGPNPLGAYCMLSVTTAAAWLVASWKKLKNWHKSLLFIVILASVSILYASYSRSAWLGAGAALIVLGLLYIPKKWRTWTIAGAASVAIILGGSYIILQNSTFVQTVIHHKDPNDKVGDDSDVGHASSLINASSASLKQPLGAGVGSTGSASLYGNNPQIVENQYLFVAHEAGWFGLILFVWLTVEILINLYRRKDWPAKAILASGVGLIVIGLFLPVMTDDTIAYVWWGLAAAMTSLGASGTIRNGRG